MYLVTVTEFVPTEKSVNTITTHTRTFTDFFDILKWLEAGETNFSVWINISITANVEGVVE